MKNKVYITSLHLKHGGVERAIILLANALVKKNYDVEILCTYHWGEPAYKLREEVKVTYLTKVRPNKEEIREAIRKKNIFALLKEGLYAIKVLYLKQRTMKDCLRNISEGCVIATRNEHAILLSKYGKSNVKKIAQLHHDHKFERRYVKSYQHKYNNIDVFVLLTEQTKTEVAEIMKDNHHTKHVVIPHFLEEARQIEGIERENQVLAVGRLHEEKGFLRMLEAWKHVETKEDYILKIVGEGFEYEKLRGKINELGLQNRVCMVGELSHPEVMKEMQKSKAYLMTSYAESFGFVLIEAMSVGLPTVAYDVRVGPRTLIADGESGYLVQDGDAEAFARKVENILNHEDVFYALSQHAVEHSKNYTEDAVIQQWIEILADE